MANEKKMVQYLSHIHETVTIIIAENKALKETTEKAC